MPTFSHQRVSSGDNDNLKEALHNDVEKGTDFGPSGKEAGVLGGTQADVGPDKRPRRDKSSAEEQASTDRGEEPVSDVFGEKRTTVGVRVGDGTGVGEGSGVGVGDGSVVGDGSGVGGSPGVSVGDSSGVGDGDGSGVGDSPGVSVGVRVGDGSGVGEGSGVGVGDGSVVGDGSGVGDSPGGGAGVRVGGGAGDSSGVGDSPDLGVGCDVGALVVAVGYLLVASTDGVRMPVLPVAAAARRLTATWQGVLFGVAGLMGVVTALPAVLLIRRYGAQPVYQAGLAGVGAVVTLFSQLDRIPDPQLFLAAGILGTVLQYAAFNSVRVATFTLLLALLPQSRFSSAVGLLDAGAGLAVTFGALLGGGLFELGGFALPFCTVGVLIFLTSAASCWMLSRKPKQFQGSQIAIPADPTSQTVCGDLQGALTSADTWLAALVLFVSFGSVQTLVPFLEPYMAGQFGASPGQVALYITLVAAVCSAACVLLGRLADRSQVNLHLLVVVGFIGAALSLLLLMRQPYLDPTSPSQPTHWLFVLGLVGQGSFLASAYVPSFGLLYSACLRSGLQDDVSTRALVSSLWNAVRSGTVFLSPLIGGAAIDAGGFSTLLLGMASLNITVAVLTAAAWTAAHHRRSDQQDSEKTMLLKTSARRDSVEQRNKPKN